MQSTLAILLFTLKAVNGISFSADVFSCFIYHPSRFLERSGTRSEGRLQNVTTCLERCIEATTRYNFICRSAMWKKDINFCILSIYDRSQKAERFRIALQSDIDLYENACTFSKDVEATKFNSDMDIVRTTMSVPVRKESTFKLKTLSSKKPISGNLFRQAREQPPVDKLSTHKPQGSPTWPVLYDSVPVQRPYKQRLGTHAKTFSASLAQQDVIVGTQFDGNSRLLFNLPSAGWKLPPIRPTSANARRFFSNTVTRPQLLATTTRTTVKAQTLDSPAKKHEVPKPLKKLSIGEYETGATVTAAESQKPCFVRSRQRSLVGFEEKIITGVDLRSCLTHCLHVSTFFCASVNYNEFEKHCTLNGGNLHLNDVQLRGSTSDYYENECSPVQNSDQRDISSITTRSTATEQCFDIFAQSMLLNLESHLERAPSLEQCKVECLKRTVSRSPPCGALNWIPHIQSCMLFEVGYDKRLIMPSSHGQFLVNKCAGNVKNSTGTDRRFSPLRYEKVSFSAEGTA